MKKVFSYVFCLFFSFALSGCLGMDSSDIDEKKVFGTSVGAVVGGGAAKLLGADILGTVLGAGAGGLLGYWISDSKESATNNDGKINNSVSKKLLDKLGLSSK